MRIEFPYVREKSQLVGTIPRPVARVILNNNYPHLLYVDSGADITLLPRSVGELIGLRKEKGEKPSRISGVGKSSVFVLIRRVTMTIGTSRFPARVAWSLVEDVPLLLGRLDIFPRFSILFQEHRKTVTFYT